MTKKIVSVGDYIEVTSKSNENYGGRFYVVDTDKYLFWYAKDKDESLIPNWAIGFYDDYFFKIIDVYHPNRNRLSNFIKTNNIRTTLVSRYLGYSKGWLTQAMTRTDRGDLDDSELQAILDKLHIDWASSECVHVKATKQHTAYKTKPCSHTTELHKARLQQSFWNGEFTHG